MICLLREWSTRPARLARYPPHLAAARYMGGPSSPPASLASARGPPTLPAVACLACLEGAKGPVVSAALREETAKGEQASGDAPRAEAAFAPENASFSDDLEAFASDYGLTRREAEVVPYIYKGRSAKVIAGTLCVSESTVRTHIRRIYEKTEVHSKQELIDLIDRY